mgnify:CR=1 FL=1
MQARRLSPSALFADGVMERWIWHSDELDTCTYLANDDLTFYGNVAKGTKPGGFNDSGSPKIAYDEEEAWNYEVGAKVTILDGRGTWNSSLYMIDWTDQQLTFNAQRPDGSLTSFIDNVGETSVTGFETELSMMLTDNWDLTANYSYTKRNRAYWTRNIDIPENFTFGFEPLDGDTCMDPGRKIEKYTAHGKECVRPIGKSWKGSASHPTAWPIRLGLLPHTHG